MNAMHVLLYGAIFILVGIPVLVLVGGCIMKLYQACCDKPENTVLYLAFHVYPIIYIIYAIQKWKYLYYTLDWPSGKSTGILVLAGIASTFVLVLLGSKIAAIYNHFKRR